MDYETVSTDVDGFNPTAKKIRLEEPITLEDGGRLQEFTVVRPQSFTGGGIGIFYNGESQPKNEVMRVQHAVDDLIRESTSHELQTVKKDA